MTASYHPDRIARNTSYLTIALAIQKALSFVYFIYISRSVGHEDIGKFLFALSVTTIFGIFIDIGLSPILTREIAKDRQKTYLFLNSTFSLKLITAVLSYGAVILFINLIDSSELTRQLVYFSGLIMIMDSFTLSFYAIFRGYQKLKYESIGVIINKVVVIAAGVIALQMGYGIKVLILAILCGSVFNVLYTMFLLFAKIKWRPKFYLDRDVLRTMFKIALPFALASIFITVFGYVDTVLLNILGGVRGDSYVGWYGTAYKLTYAFQFIPIALAASIFPAMSSYFVSSKGLLARTFERAVYYLTIISVPIAFGVFAIADKLIVRIWGDAFEASIIPLQILIFSLIFLFANFPIGSLLNACNRQARNTINIAIAMVINVVLNLILIPRYTFIGTSIASLVSIFALFVLGLYVTRQIITPNWRFLIKTLAKTVVSAGVMMAMIFALKDSISFILLIPVGIILYFIILFLLRGFGQQEYIKIYQAIRKKLI
ncbi:flippase [Patescibacteria group bacterium]|nr:flippase [Patescibacteria group bacterium]MBU1890875.1 flippase [Patescibacteria group bacterium]